MAEEREVAANRIATCFYDRIETATIQGLTNADETFKEDNKEGHVSNEEVLIIIKKVHAAIITNLKKENIAEFPEMVNAYMQSYRKSKFNGLERFEIDIKDVIEKIDDHYREHAEIVVTMIFKKYQSVIQDALKQQLDALEEQDEEVSKLMIIDFIQNVEKNCRNVQLDRFYISEKVNQAHLTKNKGKNRIVVKRENSEDGQPKKREKGFDIEVIDLTNVMSDDEEEVEEELGQSDRDSFFGQDIEQDYDTRDAETSVSRSSMVQSSDVSVLFPQASPSSSNSDSSVYYESVHGKEDMTLPLDQSNNLLNYRKRSNTNVSSSEEESGEESGQDENKQSTLSMKQAKKKVRSSDLTEADKDQALKEEEEREQNFRNIAQNLESLPPATPTAEKKTIDEVLHAAIDILLQHFQAKRQKTLPPEIRCLLKHCKQNREELQKVLRAGMLPRAQELLLSIVNGKKEIQIEDFESLHSEKGKKYSGVKMILFNHPFRQSLDIESEDYTATIDAIFITHSKAKCRKAEGHLRNYIKTPQGKNGITGKYLRTKAGFDLKNEFINKESSQADENPDKGKNRSTKEVDVNPHLCIQLWTLYERMEKRVFFDMKSMQRDVSKKFNDDPEKFKVAICKFVKHVFMIICWSFQNDKELNKQIRQAFPLSQPPMGLNYELGYSGSNPSCYKPKEQRSFKGKAGRSSSSNSSRPKDTRTKEEREWDAEQRRQANLKKYETMFAELLGEGTEAKLYVGQFSTSINVYLSKDRRIHFTPHRDWYEKNDIRGDEIIQLRLKLGEQYYFIDDPDENENDEDYGVGAELIVRKKLQDGTWDEYPYFLTSRQESCAETIKKIIQEQKVKGNPDATNS